jgi:superkiller protein 3
LFEPLLANTLSSIDPNLNALHQASFALERYCTAYPQDSSAILLHGLILERLGQFDIAIDRLSIAVSLLEAEYEAKESEELEQRYAVALLDLGRINLAQASYDTAIETLDNCFDLVSGRDDNVAILMRIQAKTGLALAHATLRSVQASLGAFQEALSQVETLKLRDTAKDELKERVSVSLAKTLWSIGGDEAFEEAKTRLLER